MRSWPSTLAPCEFVHVVASPGPSSAALSSTSPPIAKSSSSSSSSLSLFQSFNFLEKPEAFLIFRREERGRERWCHERGERNQKRWMQQLDDALLSSPSVTSLANATSHVSSHLCGWRSISLRRRSKGNTERFFLYNRKKLIKRKEWDLFLLFCLLCNFELVVIEPLDKPVVLGLCRVHDGTNRQLWEDLFNLLKALLPGFLERLDVVLGHVLVDGANDGVNPLVSLRNDLWGNVGYLSNYWSTVGNNSLF